MSTGDDFLALQIHNRLINNIGFILPNNYVFNLNSRFERVHLKLFTSTVVLNANRIPPLGVFAEVALSAIIFQYMLDKNIIRVAFSRWDESVSKCVSLVY